MLVIFNDCFMCFKMTSPVRYKGKIVSILIFLFKICLNSHNYEMLSIMLHKKLASLDFLTFGKLGTFHLFKGTKGQPYPLGVSLFHNGGNTIFY